MAATVSQQPNQTNSAYVPNVWVLDGLTTEDRYVLRVRINGVVVSTIKQPANPAGVGVFDIQKILQSYLSPSFVELTQYASDTPGAYLTYQVDYGTETGNIVTIDGTSAISFVINATDDWRVLNSDLTPFIPVPQPIICENLNVNARYAKPYRFLTNYPVDYVVRPDEYKTLSFFSKVDVGGTDFGPNAAPFLVVFTYFEGGVQTVQAAFTLANFRGSTLRTDCQDMTVSFTV